MTNEQKTVGRDNRPFENWTIVYVRKMLLEGRITEDEAEQFVHTFRDGLTMDEILS